MALSGEAFSSTMVRPSFVRCSTRSIGCLPSRTKYACAPRCVGSATISPGVFDAFSFADQGDQPIAPSSFAKNASVTSTLSAVNRLRCGRSGANWMSVASFGNGRSFSIAIAV